MNLVCEFLAKYSAVFHLQKHAGIINYFYVYGLFSWNFHILTNQSRTLSSTCSIFQAYALAINNIKVSGLAPALGKLFNMYKYNSVSTIVSFLQSRTTCN